MIAEEVENTAASVNAKMEYPLEAMGLVIDVAAMHNTCWPVRPRVIFIIFLELKIKLV